MLNPRISHVCLGVVGLFLVACSEGTFYGSASGSLAESDATTVSSAFSGTITNLSPSAAAGTPNLRIYESCTTKSPEPPTDADDDGIPATRTTTYDCSDVAHGNITLNRTGTYVETDKDDNSTTAGFRREYSVTGGHSGGETNNFVGYFDLSNSAGTFTYMTNFKSSGSSTSNDTRDSSYEYGHSYNFTITSDDANNPFVSGDVTLSGFYRYLRTNSRQSNIDITLSIASEGLKYQRGNCSKYYNAGSYTLTDGAGNVLKTTYTDCNTSTTTYNGTAVRGL